MHLALPLLPFRLPVYTEVVDLRVPGHGLSLQGRQGSGRVVYFNLFGAVTCGRFGGYLMFARVCGGKVTG